MNLTTSKRHPVILVTPSLLGLPRGRGVGDGAEASDGENDGKIYRLDSRASSRMTAQGAVSRQMAREQGAYINRKCQQLRQFPITHSGWF